MTPVRELYVRLSESIDRNSALFGSALGIVLITLYLLKSPNPYLLGVGMVAISSGIIYRKISRLQPGIIGVPSSNGTKLLVVSNIMFFAITALCVYLSATSQYTRPLYFFILVSVAFTLIGLEIIFITHIGKMYEIAWLAKIILISFILRSSLYFQFPSIVGVDAWFHKEYIQTFIGLGYIPEFTEFLQPYYLHFPLMHLSVSLLDIISPLGDLKTAMFSAMGVSLIISTLFIFLIGKKLFGQQVGLLSTLFVNFSDFHILWGTQIIATTMGVILFTAILYVILVKNLSDIRIKAVLLILLVTVVFTHTISSFVVLILFIMVLIIQTGLRSIFGKESPSSKLNVTLILCFGLIIINYWAYVNYMSQDQSFFDYSIHAIINLIDNADFLNRPMDNPSGTNPTETISNLVNIAGFLILLYFTTIGFLTSVRKDINAFRVGLLAFSLLAFIFAFPLLGLRTIIPTRWLVFLYILMVVTASYGILKQLEFTYNSRIRYLLSAIVLFLFCFFMITNGLVNMDNPLYSKESTYRYEYTDTELIIAEWVGQKYPGEIITDYYYGKTVFEIGLHKKNLSFNPDKHSEGLVVWRDYMLKSPVIVLYFKEGTPIQEYQIFGETRKKDMFGNYKIYSNGDCTSFLNLKNN